MARGAATGKADCHRVPATARNEPGTRETGVTRLSVSQAWDETRAFVVHEARVLAPLGLALLFLPAAMAGLAAPAERGATPTASQVYLAFIALQVLIGIVGQIAISRLALGHRERIGDSIGHAVRRMPAYVGAALLFAVPVSIALALVMTAATAVSKAGNQGLSLLVLVLLTLMIVGLLILFARFSLSTAIASVEGGGPVTILKRGLTVTRGQVLRLLGTAMLFLIGGGLAVYAVTVAFGSLVTLLLGPPEPLTVSLLLIAVARAAVQAAVGVVFTVLLARLYAQRVVAPGVPSSGT